MSALPLKYKHRRLRLNGFLGGPKRDLAEHDYPVKIWMPQAVWDALVELADYHEGDLSKVIRHILFVHVYGHFDYLAQLERGLSNFSPHRCSAADKEDGQDEADGPENLEMIFSRPTDSNHRTKDLGKNNHDVKVFVPKGFSEEIEDLATQARIPRSEYMRGALIMYLFGRKNLEDRRQS